MSDYSINRSGVVYSVGSIWTDGEISVIGTFTTEVDADKLYTRLEDKHVPGDGVLKNFISTSPFYVRKAI